MRIDSIGARGDGVAIVDGEKVFAPLTAPGDVAEVALRGERAAILRLIEPSSNRADPVCAHYGDCGGCGLQHVSEGFYRDWKRRLVVEALERESFDPQLVASMHPCSADTRRRVSFAVRKTAAGALVGFNERASDRIIPIKECKVLTSSLQAALPLLRLLVDATPARWRAFDLNVTQCENGFDVVFAGGDAGDDLSGMEVEKLASPSRENNVARISVGDAPIAMFDAPFVHFGGVPVNIPAGGFLQASSEGEAVLRDFAVKHAASSKRIADLFSGCGTFSLPLAASAAVDAFDSDAPAIAALHAASRAAQLRFPLTAAHRNLFERPLSADELNLYDAVVIDPPRAGARAQSEQLARSEVGRVISVSCNPASFARDAAILRDGGYHLSQVLPVDQFVYSPHVELAGFFTKE